MDLVNQETRSELQLFAGDFPRVLVPVSIAEGAGSLVKGTVLGKVTETGKYKAYSNVANDGTQTAKRILAEDVDATSAEIKTSAFASGHFNTAALTGIDDAAVADFDGTPIFIGKAY